MLTLCLPSIIFSFWTRSLDPVGIFLKSRSIDFVRIDGSHTLGQRKLILENYQKDPRIKILLMTTGTTVELSGNYASFSNRPYLTLHPSV
jgi:SNF2 family DNA or RNA helicase